MQLGDHRLQHVQLNSGIAARELVDDGGQKTGRDAFGAADVELASLRVGEELEFLDALFDLVEDRYAAPNERLAIGRRFNAVPAAVEQAKPERLLHIGDRFRDGRLRNRELGRCSGHAAVLHDSEQDVEVAQLEAASDPVDPMHEQSPYQDGYVIFI